MTIKLGIPSKGRLMDSTFDWFEARGVYLSRTGSEWEYSAEINGVVGVELVLMSASEVPRELAAARILVG
ncbi:MAG: ATP phosphoribosyltransferase catalytic subunit HisG, partial [Paracoccaceae bacterium]